MAFESPLGTVLQLQAALGYAPAARLRPDQVLAGDPNVVQKDEVLAALDDQILGLGTPPPTPSWGAMLSGSSRTYLELAPWMAIIPGVAISLAVMGINLLGDAIRDLWDPRLRGSQ